MDENFMREIKRIIRGAGQQIREARDIHARVKSNFRDLVTPYDLQIQKYLQSELSALLPEAAFIGEEDTGSGKSSLSAVEAERCFIVDPIDGTTNFCFGLKKSCTAIAYAEKGTVMAAAVYDPFLDELFWAERGKGAYLGEERLHGSRGPLEEGIFIFGTSAYGEDDDLSFALIRECYERSISLRRLGSAELDLCNVAAGRASLYFEGALFPWDIAAGSLICEEAGMQVFNWEHRPIELDKKESVVAGNAETLAQWFEILGRLRERA